MSTEVVSTAPADEVYHRGDDADPSVVGGFHFGPVPYQLAHGGIKSSWKAQKHGRFFDIDRECCFTKKNQDECMRHDVAHVNDEFEAKSEPWVHAITQGHSAPDLLFPFASPNKETELAFKLKCSYNRSSYTEFSKEAGNPLKIDIPASAIQHEFKRVGGLPQNSTGYHVLPEELTLEFAEINGLRSSVSLALQTPQTSGISRHWSPGVVISNTSRQGTGLMLKPDASGNCLRGPKRIYCTNGQETLTPTYMRLMPIDTVALEREINSLSESSNPTIVYVTPPGENAIVADTILQWLTITNYEQLLATERRKRPTVVQEIEQRGYLYSPSNRGTNRIAVPKESLLAAVRDIEKIVDAPNNLMNLSQGISLLLYPEHPNGWNVAPKTGLPTSLVNDAGAVSMNFVVNFRFLLNKHSTRESFLSL